jgi:serine/threonine protein kinase/predicted Zn-dependent protease
MRTVKPPEPGAWLSVERTVEAFERAHARLGTADPATFCPPPGDPLRLPIAAELVRVDLEFATRDGRSKRLDDYREIFPDLFEDTETLTEVAFEEYRLRRQSGEVVTADDYRQRYGIDPSSWPDDGTWWSTSRPDKGLSALHRSTDDGDEGSEPTRFPEPGVELVGFRLVRVLGRGAFSQVYLAEQADLAGRYVALKLSTRFVAEAGTLARLQHTNIVPVYSVHRVGRFLAICMPYLGAITLADVLRAIRDRPSMLGGTGEIVRVLTGEMGPDSGPTPDPGRLDSIPRAHPGPTFTGPLDVLRRMSHVEAALRIVADLADGLAHAHDRGVIHQDLKPANVLMSDEGRPMLLDFNLAGDAQNDHAAPEFIGGTPSHMAPEQLAALAGEPALVDARSDIYALGLILFELLTGQPPHPLPPSRSPRDLAWLRQARSGPVPSARPGNPAVTPAIDAILARTLAPRPADRYANARQLREDLLLQLEHRPLKHVREPSVRERARKTLRRNPWARSVPFVVGLFSVVTAIGLAGFAYRGRQLDLARAEVALAGFRQKGERARSLLMLPEPEDRDLIAGLSLGREALATYRVLDQDRWDEVSAFRHRSPEEQNVLRAELGELAFLMAGAEHRRTDREKDPRISRPILESALRLNQVAGNLLERDPARRPHVVMQRARLLQASGRSREANSLQQSVRPILERSEGLWLQIAELDRRREFRRALDLLIASEPERSGSLGYWRTRAEHHAAIGEWAEAAAVLSTALALSPRPDADLFGRRGAARLALKRFSAACGDYDAAIRLKPDDPALLRDRAQARLGLGDAAGALADLDRAQALDPSHTRVHFMRSRIHARIGDREAARRDLELGLASTPGDELSWIARGIARMARDPEGAIADFDQALQRNPSSRSAMQNKASVLSDRLDRTEEAVAVLDRLIALHPEYVPAQAGRGVLLARLGRREAAIADATVALRLSDEPFTRYQVAGIFALTSTTHPEDRSEALRLLASALRDKEGLTLLPTDPDLKPIREDPALSRLVEAARTLQTASSPTSHAEQ